MKSRISSALLCSALLLSLSSLSAHAQTAPPATAPAAAPHRTSLQWTAMKGKRTQIFIDLNAKDQSTYHGLFAGFAPTYMVQLPGDGSVDLLEYEGSGDDWKWVPVAAHTVVAQPSTGVVRVEFDEPTVFTMHNLTVIFRSLDDAWKPVASSKALPWHPN